MSLSRKNYEAVAAIVRTENDILDRRTNIDTITQWNVEQTITSIAHDLANYFAADNPRFDQARFFEACGL